MVPPPSALLTPDDEKEVEDAWCKALICRQCGAVPLLEGEPSGLVKSINVIIFIKIIVITVIIITTIIIIIVITDSPQVAVRLQVLG